MRKLWIFMRSMRFGILLLILIAVCSVIGSVIPQGREIASYAETYPNTHPAMLALQLHDIFKSWYFLLLTALLCLNLTLCSVVRISSVAREGKTLLQSMARLPDAVMLPEEKLRRIEEHLAGRGCQKTEIDGVRVYTKHRIGRYGSFLTHLAILLTVLFGAAGLYLPRTVDADCMPGDSVSLADGLTGGGGTARVSFAVDSFRTSDAEGKLDYASELTITLPDGRSRTGEIRVNHPMSFGAYKVYQQTFGTAGSVTVVNAADGGSDTFLLPDPAFLTLDGHNGVWVLALYPDYYRTPEGEITPTGARNGEYPNPVYFLQLSEDGENTPAFAFPGETMELAGLRYEFNEPARYPGLRVKYTPPAVNTLLFASFALMIAGLYITFFLPPVLVKVDGEGYAVGGPKPEGTRLELEELLTDPEEEEKS